VLEIIASDAGGETQRRWRSDRRRPSMRPRPQFWVAPCCRLKRHASLASRDGGLMCPRLPQRLVTAVHPRYRWRAYARWAGIPLIAHLPHRSGAERAAATPVSCPRRVLVGRSSRSSYRPIDHKAFVASVTVENRALRPIIGWTTTPSDERQRLHRRRPLSFE
jgi:hypothetical protein